MGPRFYAPTADAVGKTVTLPVDEGRHLQTVLRLRPGAIVSVFDGRGRAFEASVDQMTAGGVQVTTRAATPSASELTVAITLAPSVLKASRLDAVVRDATALGIVAVQPVVTDRTNVALTREWSSRVEARWRRVAIAAAKQCGRAVVPDIHPPLELGQLVDGAASAMRLILVEPAHPRSTSGGRLRPPAPPPAQAVLLVGPEGGWAPSELALAERAGFEPIGLGGRTLRAELAPVVALAALLAVWDEI